MNIIVMKKIGFCYGVNRSIEITNKVKDNYKEPWILLGPLVHNDYVNNDLINSGYQMLNNQNAINNYQNAAFISTAHGIDPILKEQIENYIPFDEQEERDKEQMQVSYFPFLLHKREND